MCVYFYFSESNVKNLQEDYKEWVESLEHNLIDDALIDYSPEDSNIDEEEVWVNMTGKMNLEQFLREHGEVH